MFVHSNDINRFDIGNVFLLTKQIRITNLNPDLPNNLYIVLKMTNNLIDTIKNLNKIEPTQTKKHIPPLEVQCLLPNIFYLDYTILFKTIQASVLIMAIRIQCPCAFISCDYYII